MRHLVVLATALLWLLMPAAALADNNPLNAACSANGGAGASSTACSAKAGGDPIAGPNGIIYKSTLIIATIAGIAAVMIVIIGGFLLVTANGDSQKVAQARTAIIGAFVGLILIAIATSIVVFVVSKL